MEDSEATLKQRRKGSTQSAPAASLGSADMSRSSSVDTPTGDGGARPSLSRTPSHTSSSSGSSTPFPLKEDDLFSGLSLIDMLVMLDAHWTMAKRAIEVWRRRADRLVSESKQRAAKLKLPDPRSLAARVDLNLDSVSLGPGASERAKLEQRISELRHKSLARIRNIQDKWEDQKIVTLRDKISFTLGVLNVLFTALMLGFDASWLPLYYTAQVAVFIPLRVKDYRAKYFHYFLFDLCYAVNLLALLFIWVFPSSTTLYQATYGLALGTLGSAIATWRNSLVFHSMDKVVSVIIHLYPPLIFASMRHYDPTAKARFPALAKLDHLDSKKCIGICMLTYLVWQILYYRYVIVARRDKIKEGRATSFTYLVNDKRRLIGKIAQRLPPQWREAAFMAGQFVYTFVTLLLPVFVLYDSKIGTSIYLTFLFGVAVWNGSSFYLEVMTGKFEKELSKLRNELEAQQRALNEALALNTTLRQSASSDAVRDLGLEHSAADHGSEDGAGVSDTHESFEEAEGDDESAVMVSSPSSSASSRPQLAEAPPENKKDD